MENKSLFRVLLGFVRNAKHVPLLKCVSFLIRKIYIVKEGRFFSGYSNKIISKGHIGRYNNASVAMVHSGK